MPNPQRITPLLVYADIQASHDFLVTAFGFEPGRIDRDGDGHIVHGEVSAAGEVIWLHRATAKHGLHAPRTDAQSVGGIAILVDDVDSHYEQARSAGASIERPPVDQPYGRREYEARDPEGHRWWFASLLS
jgi:uncharacterized glyoxalase superfamily protein PhnB